MLEPIVAASARGATGHRVLDAIVLPAAESS
jgi:hypothetical protein